MVFRRYRSCSFDSVRFRRCRLFLRDLVSDDAGYPFKGFVSDDAGRGALRSPTPPRATGCERGASLSRSPGAGLAGSLVSDDAGGVLLTAFVSDNAGVVLLTAFVSDDAGGVLLTAFVSDKAGTALLRFFFPDGAGVRRSAPLHSLGRRGARGLRSSRALPGLLWRGVWFPTMQGLFF